MLFCLGRDARNHLGTPQALTGSAGGIAWRGDYAPCGAATTSGSLTFNLRFPGQYFDAESGLHYNWYRYYDPETGRYITSDPIGLADGLNTYAYVGGNPLDRIDPLGLAACPTGTVRSGTPCWLDKGDGQGSGYPNEGRCATATCAAGIGNAQPPRAPDFVNFQIDLYVASFWGTFSRDGESFVGCGFYRTYPNPVSFGASTSVGWLNTLDPEPGQTSRFLNGYAGSGASAYYGVGGGILWSPGNGAATVIGVGAGVSYGSSNAVGGGIGAGSSFRQGDTGVSW